MLARIGKWQSWKLPLLHSLSSFCLVFQIRTCTTIDKSLDSICRSLIWLDRKAPVFFRPLVRSDEVFTGCISRGEGNNSVYASSILRNEGLTWGHHWYPDPLWRSTVNRPRPAVQIPIPLRWILYAILQCRSNRKSQQNERSIQYAT